MRRWWQSLDPAIRLTGSYLLIIMLISFFFSVVLYYMAAGQLSEGLRHQYLRFGCGPGCDPQGPVGLIVREELAIEKGRLIAQLAYFNILILIMAAASSLWLARRTLRPIEAALEAQSRFSSDASHELRTPLSAMQAEIEVALRNKKLSKDEAINVLKSNLEEVIKLRGLSDSLLRLARENGLDYTAVDLKIATAEAVSRLQVLADKKHIKIVDQTDSAIVSGDYISLVDLISILIDNAVKYSPENSQITILSDTSSRFASLTVKDNGPGIGNTHLTRIFERFYRADVSRTGSGGYGLGLSIAKKLADLHQGKIEVKSQAGKGSEFTLKIPVLKQGA